MTKQVQILSLPTKQFLAVCYSDSRYMDAIDETITEFAEADFNELICDYLEGCNYSIGLYNHNYITVKDTTAFFDGMANKVEHIATSDKVIKAYNHAKALKEADSNLFGYTVENELKDAIMDEVIQIAKYYEDMQYRIYCKDTENEQLNDFVFNNIQFDVSLYFGGLVVDLETGAVTDTSVQTYIGADTLNAIKQAMAKPE